MQKFIFVLFLFLVYQGFAQKVGINNTDPQTSLDVNGKLRIRSYGVIATAPTTTLPNGQYGYYSIYGTPGTDFSITMPTGVKGSFILIENTTLFTASIVGLSNIQSGKSKLFLYGNIGWILANDSESQLEKITELSTNGWRLLGANPDNYGNIGEKAIDLSISNFPSSVSGATGKNSIAMGYDTEASASYSTAMGYGTVANGINSTAIGKYTLASGQFSTAMGYNSIANGPYSTAMGFESIANGEYSTAFGWGSEAYGKYSTSMGYQVNASSRSSVAIGQFNDTIAGSSRIPWVDTDPLFMIGNGVNTSSLKNAMTVYKNGNTDLNGFVRIGEVSDGAPRIKTKKIIGTSHTGYNSEQSIAHNLTASKILSVSVLIEWNTNLFAPPMYSQSANLLYNYYINSNNIVIRNDAPSGDCLICNKPVKILITYEE